MPFGVLADYYGSSNRMAAAGCVLIALAVLAPHPMAVAIAGGVGNSLFHIGGGTAVLRENPAQLSETLRRAIFEKPRAHCFEDAAAVTERRGMSQIGG